MYKVVKQYKEQLANPTASSSQPVSTEFVEHIKRWVELDDQIKENLDKNKTLKKEKETLSKTVMSYMSQNHIEKKDINISNGQVIRCKESQRAVPINRPYIQTRLTEYFKGDAKKAEEATAFIFENREKVVSKALSRYHYAKKGKK